MKKLPRYKKTISIKKVMQKHRLLMMNLKLGKLKDENKQLN